MTREGARGLLVVAAAALLTGCALVTTGSTPRSLAESHHRRAAALEQKGELRRALDEWKIALTIEPQDRVARDRKARLERRLAGAVAAHTRLAQEALRRGAPVEARRHLLAALALDPANRTAFETLQGVREVPFAVHTVGRGETLADIAERYYGDRLRAEVIWQSNQLPARTRLTAGMELKIPEIPGLPFRVDPKGTGGHDLARDEMEPEVNPLLADTREAYDRGQYDLALAGVERLLDGNPHNPEWMDLKKAILYAFGKASLDQKRYDDSYHTFSQLARLDAKYQDGSELARETRLLAIQHHYNEGIRLYREEQVEAAIAEWRLVLQYEPQHPDARKNIEQAQRVLRALQERQRRQ